MSAGPNSPLAWAMGCH